MLQVFREFLSSGKGLVHSLRRSKSMKDGSSRVRAEVIIHRIRELENRKESVPTAEDGK